MADIESASLIADGKESIEHQLEIQIADLLLVGTDASFNLPDILTGLRYIVEYRIKGRKLPNIRKDICEKLVTALLLNIAQRQGSLLSKSLTHESDLVFTLFGEFLEELDEFGKCVGEYSATDLRQRLKLHLRIEGSEQQREAAVNLLEFMTARFPQFTWKDLVKEEYHKDTEEALKKYEKSTDKLHMPVVHEKFYAPQNLFFDRKIKDVVRMLDTNTEKGLDLNQVEERRKHFGPNELPKPEPASIWKLLWVQLSDFMIVILIITTIVSAVVDRDKPTSAIVLAIVIIINVIIGFTQEYKANKALQSLLTLSIPTAKVVRKGEESIVSATELVPGDVVILEEGDSVPADLRLIQVSQLEVVEAILTGESVPNVKNTERIIAQSSKLPLADCHANAFMATVTARGRGRGIVVRTGSHTEIGKISSAITSVQDSKTPIQKKLSRLGKVLILLAILLSILVVIAGLAYNNDTNETIRVGLSLAVSVIPEGLVAVVTVTMALAVKRMAKVNAVVRKLPSVETLGSVTIICTDKTGTLTEGKMSPQELWTSDESTAEFRSPVSDPENGTVVYSTEQNTEIKLALMICALCNNSVTRKDDDGVWQFIGDSTDIALLVAAQHAKMGKAFWNMNKIDELAFDSDRKLQTVVMEIEGQKIVLTKGAPEAVLSKCTKFISNNQNKESMLSVPNVGNVSVSEMNEDFLKTVTERNSSMALKGLRVIGLSMKLGESDEASPLESELCFVGLIGLIDPPRASVKDSVEKCKTAGIKVFMITGDHLLTASAIATSLGIMDPNDPSRNRAIRGRELDLLNDEGIANLDPFPSVFARVSPENKLAIVRVLQSMGENVAMTGDGVNDAPAIKKADVGVSMGITGTDITKQAADIVLGDDNFSTIVLAVEEGRRVFDNINKFIVYLLSCNSAEIWTVLIAVVAGVRAPFSAINILWSNIIADIPPSMSLGVEPKELDIMERKPRDPKLGIITKRTGFIILTQGIVLAALTLSFYFYEYIQNDSISEQVRLRSEAFITLTTLQLVLSFMSRSITLSVFQTGIKDNKYLIFAFFLSFGLLLFGLYVPGVNDILELEPISYIAWLRILFSCIVLFAVSEGIKFVLRRRDRLREINE